MSTHDRQWRDSSERFRRDVMLKVLRSDVCLQLYRGEGADFDLTQATELGALLLLDKPIVLVCLSGCSVPTRLAKAADVVIEDWSPDNLDAQDRLDVAVRRISEQA